MTFPCWSNIPDSLIRNFLIPARWATHQGLWTLWTDFTWYSLWSFLCLVEYIHFVWNILSRGKKVILFHSNSDLVTVCQFALNNLGLVLLFFCNYQQKPKKTYGNVWLEFHVEYNKRRIYIPSLLLISKKTYFSKVYFYSSHNTLTEFDRRMLVNLRNCWLEWIFGSGIRVCGVGWLRECVISIHISRHFISIDNDTFNIVPPNVFTCSHKLMLP